MDRMEERPKIDYVDPEEWIRAKAADLGIDTELPERMGFYPVLFRDLDFDRKEEVTDFYVDGWEHVLEAEYREGRIGSSISGLPLREAIKECTMEQLITSGERFPEGQIVLTDKLRTPVVLTRSQIISVPDTDDDCFDNYPKTWYEVTYNGFGYPWVPGFNNGACSKFRDYWDILGRDNPLLNVSDDLVISNYALTGNSGIPRHEARGASLAAVTERARFALKNGLRHCDTFSPLNNFAGWLREMKDRYPGSEFTPRDFIEENVVKPLSVGEKPRVYTAVGMHMRYGARSMAYFPEARTDPGSLNYCGVCRYF